MSAVEWLAVTGMLAGAAVFVLGIAQLTCEHPDAPWLPRACVAVLALLGVWVGADSWDVWAGLARPADPKAIELCAVLALHWAWRRGRGVRTHYRTRMETDR